jgi:hypothetical protein
MKVKKSRDLAIISLVLSAISAFGFIIQISLGDNFDYIMMMVMCGSLIALILAIVSMRIMKSMAGIIALGASFVVFASVIMFSIFWCVMLIIGLHVKMD